MLEFLTLMFETMARCIFLLNQLAFNGVGFFTLMVCVIIYDIIISNVIRRG